MGAAKKIYWDSAEDTYKELFGKKAWIKLHNRHFHKKCAQIVTISGKIGESKRPGRGKIYSSKSLSGIKSNQIGGCMELQGEALKSINKEVEESRKILQGMSNDIRITADTIMPEMAKIVKKIRDTRMTITTELSKSLSMMRDVRKFFLEDEHSDEVDRLERFIGLSERLKSLIEDGTMNAICDIILKLEIKEQ